MLFVHINKANLIECVSFGLSSDFYQIWESAYEEIDNVEKLLTWTNVYVWLHYNRKAKIITHTNLLNCIHANKKEMSYVRKDDAKYLNGAYVDTIKCSPINEQKTHRMFKCGVEMRIIYSICTTEILNIWTIWSSWKLFPIESVAIWLRNNHRLYLGAIRESEVLLGKAFSRRIELPL